MEKIRLDLLPETLDLLDKVSAELNLRDALMMGDFADATPSVYFDDELLITLALEYFSLHLCENIEHLLGQKTHDIC